MGTMTKTFGALRNGRLWVRWYAGGGSTVGTFSADVQSLLVPDCLALGVVAKDAVVGVNRFGLYVETLTDLRGEEGAAILKGLGFKESKS